MCGSLSKWPDHCPWPRRARREPELWEHFLCNRHLNHACSNVNYAGSLNPYKNPARGLSVLFCISGEIGSDWLRNTSKITQLARCRDRLQVHSLCVGGSQTPKCHVFFALPLPPEQKARSSPLSRSLGAGGTAPPSRARARVVSSGLRCSRSLL